MKNRYLRLPAILLLCAAMSGCGGNGSSVSASPSADDVVDINGSSTVDDLVADGGGSGKITVCVPQGDYVAFMNDTAIPKYQEENPNVKVDVIADSELDTMIAAGDYPNLYTGGFGARGMRYAQSGVLVPLNSFSGYDELAARVDPSYLEQYAGYNFYIPWNLTTTMMIINRDLFQQAGLDPDSPPETFDEFLTDAKAIDALGDDYYGCFFWNEQLTAGGWYWDMLAPIYYNFNGGKYQLLNSMGTDVVFDKPEAKMADFFNFLKEAQQYAPLASSSTDSNLNFFGRKVGMWPQYGYGWKGNLASAADRPMVIGEDVNVVPIPVVNKGDTHYSTLGGNGLVVFKTSDEAQQNSWKFLQTLMEDDVNLEADTKLGQLPSLLTLQGNSFFDDPSEQPFVQQTLTALPGEPYAAADTIAAYVLNAIQASVVDGSVSVEDAIAQAAQKARADLQ